MKKQAAKLIFIFLIAFALFNFPVLSIFNQPSLWGGIPPIVMYIFIVWILIIFALWRVFHKT
jgi:lipopolysaccharide export LptBFGC system permease protein LptF